MTKVTEEADLPGDSDGARRAGEPSAPAVAAIRRRAPWRLERRVDRPLGLRIAVPILSMVVAIVLGGILVSLSGNDPIATYDRILDRAVFSDGALTGTFVYATPLLFTGLAAAVAFRVGIFNIGGDGQFVVGSIAASGLALGLADHGYPVVLVAMIVGGGLAGAAWAAIAGALRAWLNTNEIITTLMLNYVALNLADYLIFGSHSHWRNTEGTARQFPQGRSLAADLWWTPFRLGPVTIPLGYVLGAVVAVVLFLIARRSRFGFSTRVIGDEPRAARYAGIRTRRTIFAVMALSGAVAGLGGASNVGDARHNFDPKGLGQAGYGYTGIVVAALARFNPLAVVGVALVMGGLSNAGASLQGPGFPAGLVGTLQALLLITTLAGELFATYRIRRSAPAPPVAPEEPSEVPS